MIDDRAGDAPRAGRPAVFSPLYQQIKGLLVQSLERGEWKPGELIPSEIELAALQALDQQVLDLLVQRRKHRGPSGPRGVAGAVIDHGSDFSTASCG